MWLRMTDIAVAKEYLEAGMLYENWGSPDDPVWHKTDYLTRGQLDHLRYDPEYCWPIQDYAIYLED